MRDTARSFVLLMSITFLTPAIAGAQNDATECIKKGGVWVINFQPPPQRERPPGWVEQELWAGKCWGDVPPPKGPLKPWDRYPGDRGPFPPEPTPPPEPSRNPLWNALPPLKWCGEDIDKPSVSAPPSGLPERPPEPMDCVVTRARFKVEILSPTEVRVGSALTTSFSIRVKNTNVGTALRGYRMTVVISGAEEMVLTRILGAYDLSPGQTITYPFAGAEIPLDFPTGDYQICVEISSEDMIGWGLSYSSNVACQPIQVTDLAIRAMPFEPPP